MLSYSHLLAEESAIDWSAGWLDSPGLGGMKKKTYGDWKLGSGRHRSGRKELRDLAHDMASGPPENSFKPPPGEGGLLEHALRHRSLMTLDLTPEHLERYPFTNLADVTTPVGTNDTAL